MLVLGVNQIGGWCQIISNGRRYSCITKVVDGQLLFHFKRAWHPVMKYLADNAEELVQEGGKVFLRKIIK